LAAYLIRRFLLMLLTLFGISVLVFVLLRIVPGNIADILFSAAGMINPAEKLEIEKQLGLDLPVYLQYAHWIGGLLQGDLGYSYVSEKPTLDEILPRLPISAKLAGLALAVRGAVRHSARRDLGGAAEHGARLRAARGESERPVAAVVLARAADPDGVRALFRLDPDLHDAAQDAVGRAACSTASGRRSRFPLLGADDAADALLDARSAAAGLHPHRAREGCSYAKVNFVHALRNAVLPIVTIVGSRRRSWWVG
jgi:peptide/nickel transport system permease protein